MKIGYLMQLGTDIRFPPFNGPANHTRHVVAELQRRGHSVHVLFNLERETWLSDGLDRFEQVTIKWTEYGPFRVIEKLTRRIQALLGLPYAGWFESVRFAAACIQMLKECDLLYERTSWLGYGGSLASRWLGTPLILEDNGDHLVDLEAKGIAPKGFQRWLALQLMKISVMQATQVISSGDGWRTQFIHRWRFEPNKITAVENGTTLVEILARQDLRSFRQPVKQDLVRLVYLGGFYAWHGVHILLKSFQRSLEHGLKAELLFIGAGEEMRSAHAQVDALDLNEHVVFKGQLLPEEYAPLLASADIGLAPYCNWPEFSGLKIFDYKASGLPAIVSGQEGMPRIIKHGETGWIVPPCDEDALFKAIMTLGFEAPQRRRIGQAARLDAEKSHGWSHTADRLEAIFMNVLRFKESNDQPLGKHYDACL